MENEEIKKDMVYLDQNIYSDMLKNKPLKEFVKDRFIVLYSDTTLDEFEGKPELTQQYIDVLNEFENRFVENVLDDNNQEADEGRIVDVRPIQIMAMRAENHQLEALSPLSSMLRTSNKYFGGLKGTTFEELAQEQKELVLKLLDEVEKGTSDFFNDNPEMIQKMADLKKAIPHIFDHLKSTYKENIPDQENFTGPKGVRELIKLGPKELNNLKPPRVVDQILQLLLSRPELKSAGITAEKILGFENVQTKNPLSKCSKVTMVYQWLNFIGYYPDSDMESENRTRASFRDVLHGSKTMFCPAILTKDHAFASKLDAVYDYLEIGTRVIYLGNKPFKNRFGEGNFGATAV